MSEIQAASGAFIPEQPLVNIGDIVVTPSWVITPTGRAPTRAVIWMFNDMSRTTQTTPAWAIVLAVIGFFFFFLGLLFLLVKETRTEGHVQIIVQGPGLLHTAQLPVSSVGQMQDYSARVNYARSATAAAQAM